MPSIIDEMRLFICNHDDSEPGFVWVDKDMVKKLRRLRLPERSFGGYVVKYLDKNGSLLDAADIVWIVKTYDRKRQK